MLNSIKASGSLIALGTLLVCLSACQKNEATAEGPAEKAGQKIDQAATKVGEEMNKAAEKAGKGLQEFGQKLENEAKQAQQTQKKE